MDQDSRYLNKRAYRNFKYKHDRGTKKSKTKKKQNNNKKQSFKNKKNSKSFTNYQPLIDDQIFESNTITSYSNNYNRDMNNKVSKNDIKNGFINSNDFIPDDQKYIIIDGQKVDLTNQNEPSRIINDTPSNSSEKSTSDQQPSSLWNKFTSYFY